MPYDMTKKQFTALIPALVWLLAITYLSTRGNVQLPKFDLLASDKLAHASAYCLLAWLALSGLARVRRPLALPYAYCLGIFLFAAGYGALMEVVQYTFFPNRFFEVDDMIANTVGAAIGWLVFARILPGNASSATQPTSGDSLSS